MSNERLNNWLGADALGILPHLPLCAAAIEHQADPLTPPSLPIKGGGYVLKAIWLLSRGEIAVRKGVSTMKVFHRLYNEIRGMLAFFGGRNTFKTFQEEKRVKARNLVLQQQLFLYSNKQVEV